MTPDDIGGKRIGGNAVMDALTVQQLRRDLIAAARREAALREALTSITRRGQRPANRGEYIEHRVDEIHSPGDACEFCAALNAQP